MPRLDPRRRAFSLIEVLSIVVLITTIGVITARLIVDANKSAGRSTAAQAAAARFDTMLDQIRRDTWNATQITAGADGPTKYLRLTVSGKTITWISTSDGTVTRTEGSLDDTRVTPNPQATRTFPRIPPLTFSAAGATLRVTVADKSESIDTVLASQRLLAEAAK